ncbi:unnamed protein product [Strongylus vulgaris]|uniref:Ionotropic glutamate receptor L-glutamate and glycine-binding domain-containing protein n=1 Tax=Strongylus vulgaris TaxID=40348 RepID=A0A3P7L2D0_STRVU|nr:unnamed protein product [Strongylus vulgaris]
MQQWLSAIQLWQRWGDSGWNGLVADLINNKADMCVTSLKLNSERARDIDFSLPFLETGIAIITINSRFAAPTGWYGQRYLALVFQQKNSRRTVCLEQVLRNFAIHMM